MKKTLICILTAAMLLTTSCATRVQPQNSAESEAPEESAAVDAEDSIVDYLPGEKLPDPEHALAELPLSVSDLMQPTADASSIDLSFPQTFAVTRPDKPLTTTLDSYFITGTSDPSRPVYFGDTEIQRQGTKGVFGVHVSLAVGTNSFAFRQGDDTATVTITRRAAAGEAPISDIVGTSMFPYHMGGVKVGGKLYAECTAPSGATVTATFGDRTVTLQQSAERTSGYAVAFRGSIPVSGDYPSDETTKSGKITYQITWNGATKTHQSNGDVYVAGTNSAIVMQVTNYLGFVYDDPSNLAVFREKLKRGATDYIAGYRVTTDSEYFQLSGGGYLPAEQAEILTGRVSIANTLSSASLRTYDKYETYTFSGTATPSYFTKVSDGSFAITFFNTSGTPRPDVSSSRLFSGVSVTDNGGSVSYVFTMKSGGIPWGYDVTYDANSAVLRMAYKPKAGTGTNALEGITIMLDPGHGGSDPGAFGMAGESVNENMINLAHAYAAKEALEAMGARVLMTRTEIGNTVSLDERLEIFGNSNADLYVSMHHNSLLESTNGNTVQGTEIYYHTTQSQNTANAILSGFTTATGRTSRRSMQSYYRVTLLDYAPSMLIELGYLCNPIEFEAATSQSEITKAGNALANSIRQALQ